MSFASLSQPPEPDEDDSQELDLRQFDQDGDPIDWTARYKPGDVFSTPRAWYEVRAVGQEEIVVKKKLIGLLGGSSAITLYLKPWNFADILGHDFARAKREQSPTIAEEQQMMLPPDTRTVTKPSHKREGGS